MCRSDDNADGEYFFEIANIISFWRLKDLTVSRLKGVGFHLKPSLVIRGVTHKPYKEPRIVTPSRCGAILDTPPHAHRHMDTLTQALEA